MDPVKTNEGISTEGNPNPSASPATPGVPAQAPVVPIPTTPEGAPATPEPGGSPASGATEASMVPLPALQEERTQRQNLQAELDALRSAVAGNQNINTQPGQQTQAQPQQSDYVQQMDKLWDADPRKAVQAEVMAGITWMDNVNSSLESQMDNLAVKDPSFNQYRPMVRSYLKNLPLDQRGKQGIADLALAVVKGQNVDDIVQRTKNELYEKFKRGELAGEINPPSAGTFSQATLTPGTGATPEEVATANAMNMTVEDYIANKK